MEFLASDALNGRGSGTRDEWIAATYLGSQMQMLGLEPQGDGYVHSIEIERPQTSAPPVVAAAGRSFTHAKDIRVLALGSAATSGPLQKYKSDSSFRAGAVVLLPPTILPFGPIWQSALQAGVAAVLSVDDPKKPRLAGSMPLPHPPATLVGVGSPATGRPSVIVVGKEAHAELSGLPEATSVTISAELKEPVRTRTWNAVGRLTGRHARSAREVILLSAHLDHLGARPSPSGLRAADTIYNGADDDASGTVAVLELARALASGRRPQRTVVFAFFGSEEAGGFGSAFFAEKPVVPLNQIVANLQFEMIGRPDPKVPPRTLWLTGYERSTLGPALARRGAKLMKDPHPEENFFFRSDNIGFARRGVVAHTVSSFGLHKDYHQPSDEVGTIDFPNMVNAIRSLVEPVRWLADSSYTPEWLPGMKPE